MKYKILAALIASSVMLPSAAHALPRCELPNYWVASMGRLWCTQIREIELERTAVLAYVVPDDTSGSVVLDSKVLEKLKMKPAQVMKLEAIRKTGPVRRTKAK